VTDAPVPLLEMVDLEKHFPITRSLADQLAGRPARAIHAVDGVTLTVAPGETLGLIGESGSGKTTLGWMLARLHEPTHGTIRFDGKEVTHLKGTELRTWRRNVQIVFQDPVGSLDPRLRVWQIVGEPIRAQNIVDRWYARNHARLILEEHHEKEEAERERLYLECHPVAKERARLTKEVATNREALAERFDESRARREREFHEALERADELRPQGVDPKAPPSEDRPDIKERARLTKEYEAASHERTVAYRADLKKLHDDYRIAYAQAGHLTLSAEEQRRRDAEYERFRKEGLPPPTIEPIPVPPKLGRAQVREKVRETLPKVGLPVDCLDQYPHEFSGGGRQRLSLARALAVSPRLIILDEPTSALDVAVQAQILNRLVDLQRTRGLAYVLITHNVAAVRFVADKVAVMYLGRIVEYGPVRELLEHPVHPYTKALLAAVPVPDASRRRTRYRIGGDIPSLVDLPLGCRFAPRCPFVIDRCRTEDPPLLRMAGTARLVSCHRADEVKDIRPESLLSTGPDPARERAAPGAPLKSEPAGTAA
jgi:oligopeptide/dipeptide ABC transporter ATP-binding protein